jgi:hypothetical protein
MGHIFEFLRQFRDGGYGFDLPRRSVRILNLLAAFLTLAEVVPAALADPARSPL